MLILKNSSLVSAKIFNQIRNVVFHIWSNFLADMKSLGVVFKFLDMVVDMGPIF